MTVSLCAQLLTRKQYKVLKQMLFYRHLQCNIYILSYICPYRRIFGKVMASCFIYQVVKMAVFWGFMTVSLCAQLLTRKRYKVLKQMLFCRHLQCNIYILSYI